MKNFLLFLATILSFSASAQWELVKEFEQPNLYILHLSPSNQLFLGGERGNVYKQKTDGTFTVSNIEEYALMGDITFKNDLEGYVGAGCYYVTANCSPGTIFKTKDGGDTWELIHQDGSTGVINSIAIAGSKVFALGDYTDLIYSVDDGATWETKSVNPANTVGYYSNLTFLDENTGFLAGQSGGSGAIYKTNDGGENWSVIYGGSNTITDLYGFTFVSPQIGFASHSNGQIAKTTDGGATWRLINYTSNTEEFGQKITFVTAQVGYLSSYVRDGQKNILYKTTDGGETWAVDYKAENGIYDFVFSDSQNGYALMSNGKLYKRSGTVTTTDEPLEMDIFPNPSKEQFQIKSLDLPAGVYNLRVVNTLGQVVISTENIYNSVNISKLMVGTYIVEVLNDEGHLVARSKLLKQP